MDIIKKIGWNLIHIFKKIYFLRYKLRLNYLNLNIPYYSQLNTGTKNKKKHKLWIKNGCGMACLQMILDHSQNKKIPLYKLEALSLKYGCFIENPKNPDGLDGLFYKPFIEFIDKEFNLQGKIISPMLFEEIINNLIRKNYVIASVSSKIRNPKDYPKKNRNGGHLVLITGFDFKNKVLFLNNPSGDTESNTPIYFSDFKNFFANRGIVIKGG